MSENLDRMNTLLEDLEKSQRFLSEFFGIAHDLLGIFDLKTTQWVRVNDAWTRELGLAPEDICNVPIYELIHPDDVEMLEQSVEHLATGVIDRVEADFQNRYKTSDGSYVKIDWTGVLDREYCLGYCVGRIAEEN